MNAGGATATTVRKKLLCYRSTPHATTGRSPALLLLQRELRTRLHLLKPDCEGRVLNNQDKQVRQHDQHVRARKFVVGQDVNDSGEPWIPGVVTQKSGPVSYVVETEKGSWRRRIDQGPSDLHWVTNNLHLSI